MSRRLALGWLLGVGLITGLSYGTASWLWSAAESSRAAATERTVVSVLADDLAEGNLFRLSATVTKLERDGQIRSARLVTIQDGAATVSFKTVSAHDAASPLPTGFSCGEPRRVFRNPDGGLSVLTTLPTRISGLDCAALYFDIDLPPELVRFKNRLLASFLGLTIALLGLFSWFAYAWHQRILGLELSNAALRSEKEAEIGRIAAQVAHDIRSPLAALETSFADASRFPPGERALIRGSLERIRDVANSLLERQRGAARSGDDTTLQPLGPLVEAVVVEKRALHRYDSSLRIVETERAATQDVTASLQPIEFKRLLSNLINNAVEALPGGAGTVRIAVSTQAGTVSVSVSDDGRGIPPDLLDRLGLRGETHGKSGGTGLGLHHAHACATAWGGRLDITSRPGEGTTVALVLPQAAPPLEWQRTRENGCDAILIDDDALARATWQAAAVRKGKRLLAFAAPTEFFAAAAGLDRKTPVYVDSDLGDGIFGSEESRRVSDLGFTEVYLATGHEPGKFAGLSHLRGIIGKEPPWGDS